MPADPLAEWVSIEVYAERIHKHVRTVRREIDRDPEFPAIKEGRDWLVHMPSIAGYRQKKMERRAALADKLAKAHTVRRRGKAA